MMHRKGVRHRGTVPDTMMRMETIRDDTGD
ncbi:hypothetical protein HNQ56_003364 [Anaerotaenia torta]